MSGRRLLLILLPILIVATALQARHGMRRWTASYQLAQVERLVIQLDQGGHLRRNPLDRNVRKALDGALDIVRQAAELDPAEVGIPIARGALYNVLRRPQAAVRAYEDALILEPRPEIYANLGRTLWQDREKREEAREAFRTAVKLDRNLGREFRQYLPELEKQARQNEKRKRQQKKIARKITGKAAVKSQLWDGKFDE